MLRTEELHAEQVKMNHRKAKMTEEERKERKRETVLSKEDHDWNGRRTKQKNREIKDEKY